MRVIRRLALPRSPLTANHPPGAATARVRRFAADASCTLLAYALALNLLWEMWSETGTVGMAMDLSMALFSVPGRWLVYMLLPWASLTGALNTVQSGRRCQ